MLRFFFMAAALLVAALGVSAGIAPASGQAIPKSLQEGGTEEVVKQRLNQWTIGLAGGNLDGTNLRFADEIRRALDDGDELRVIPMITRGTASNLEDLLYLHGVDVAFTQSDVFEYFRTQRKIPNLEKRIQYVIRLPVAELHILAGAGIRTLEDLRGKKVVFGAAGNASTLTGPIVFQRLGIQVEPVFVSRAEGLRRLMAGEAAALLASLPKPIDFYLKIVPNSGLHMVPVPFTRVFADLYAVGELTNADYPNLIPPGQRIDTIATPTVLAVYNWPKNTDRYRRIERFVQYLFNRWDKLTKPPFHPRWRDVNLAATVPGWTRFATSEEMLRQTTNRSDQPSFQDFETYLTRETHAAPRTEAERAALFRQFMIWRQQQKQ